MKSFYEWAIEKSSVKGKLVNSPTGDLARDMRDDPTFPKKGDRRIRNRKLSHE